jgi:hypothetical protein
MHQFNWEPRVAVIVYVGANQLSSCRGNIIILLFSIAQKKQPSEGGEFV